jgi:aminoglycoside 6'-N-acetyltransferase
MVNECMSIFLRLATLNDLPLLKYWDKKPHVLFATGSEAHDDEDDWMEQQLKNPSTFVWVYIAELNGRPIGVIQIIDPANEETHYWGKIENGLRAIDIWIGEEDDLGKGYGTEMMRLALVKCFEDGDVKAVMIDPLAINTRAIKFYQKMGFKFVENRYFGEDFCAVHRFEIKNVGLT